MNMNLKKLSIIVCIFISIVLAAFLAEAAEKTDKPTPYEGSYKISELIESAQPENIGLAKKLLDDIYPLFKSKNNIIPTNIREYFEATKNYSWAENTGIPNAIKIIDYWTLRAGGIALGTEDEDTIGYRWYAEGIGPREEVWNKDNRSYYFEALYRLTKLALTSDPKRPDSAKAFDYNRVVDVASKTKVELWEDHKALTPVDVEFSDHEIKKALGSNTYILSKELSATKKDEPAIKLGGVFYTLTPKYYENDRAYQVSTYTGTALYGPEGAFVDEFVDMAHNFELFRANMDIALMYDTLAKKYENRDKKKHDDYREEYDLYKSEADAVKDTIFKYLWNEDLGTFFNYSNHTDGQRTCYPFITAGLAAWAEIFDVGNEKELNMLMRLADYLEKNFKAAGSIENIPIARGLTARGLEDYAKKLELMDKKNEGKALTKAVDSIKLTD